MFTRSQLLDVIDELELSPNTYQNCEKLATFYTIYDHLYGENPSPQIREPLREVIIGSYGESDFLSAVEGKSPEAVFPILDELMQAVMIFQPRLYEATLQKLRE